MIDTHVHFWNYDPIRDNWITDEMGAICKNFSPKNLSRVYNELQIEGCVAVQANQSEIENRFLLGLAEQSDLIKGIVGWIDFLNPEIEQRLNYWSFYKKIKGWRHVLQAENEQFILNRHFISGLKALKKHQYTYDLLCYHNQLKHIIKMVDQVPDQPFVLDHCGKPNIKSGDIKNWKVHIKTLSENPNVLCKISGLLCEADWRNWKESEMFTCFDTVFECFGAERVMYGSDWPVMLVSRPYHDWFNLIAKYMQGFTQKEKNKVFSENAKNFYSLNMVENDDSDD
ncbi:amidohydrolase family protein [Pedobacter sp. MW01-1-1]|uniref:amidohydrolase family protein n=1 Tax=Pedobacter sp. MW01-1-1 TaxID=3383027 RepID=UPI003FF061CF